MKIEVLYVAECPSHPAAVKLVRDVLSSEGVAAEIREVLVADEAMATDLAFSGSPTIRINGRDVAGVFPDEGVCLELPPVSGLCRNRSPSR
jgi:hypothetical protein